MSFSLTKPGGWAPNEKQTSAQITNIDLKTSRAVDKTIAGDTVAGVLSFSAVGGVTIANGASQIVQSGGVVTLESGAVMTLGMGGQLSTALGSSVVIQGGMTSTVGSAWVLNGTTSMSNATITGTERLKLSPRAVPRVALGNASSPEVAGVSHFAPSAVEIGAYVQQTVAPSTPFLKWDLPAKHNATLASCQVFFKPPGSHVGQPGLLPRLILYRRHVQTGVLTSVGTVFYSWVDLPTYEAAGYRTLNLGLPATGLDRTVYRYFFMFAGESGANALTGLLVETPILSSTISEYDEG